jgi:glycolate oxidase iron-sulfur subunit
VVDADPGGLCCGAAGVYQIDHPETSEQLGIAKADKVRATGAPLVASANAGCEMQLRRYLDAGYEVLHPVEIYARETVSHQPSAISRQLSARRGIRRGSDRHEGGSQNPLRNWLSLRS